MNTPPGYITREHADRLRAAHVVGVKDVLRRLVDRMTPLVAAESDIDLVRKIIAGEIATAQAELASLTALQLERIHAGVEH